MVRCCARVCRGPCRHIGHFRPMNLNKGHKPDPLCHTPLAGHHRPAVDRRIIGRRYESRPARMGGGAAAIDRRAEPKQPTRDPGRLHSPKRATTGARPADRFLADLPRRAHARICRWLIPAASDASRRRSTASLARLGRPGLARSRRQNSPPAAHRPAHPPQANPDPVKIPCEPRKSLRRNVGGQSGGELAAGERSAAGSGRSAVGGESAARCPMSAARVPPQPPRHSLCSPPASRPYKSR